MVEIVKLIADVGGSLGLALFAIWILQRSHKEQEDRGREDREALLEALERNTQAWVGASTVLTAQGKACEENSRCLARLTGLLMRSGMEVAGDD